MTPGRKPSISASARPINSSAASAPSLDFMSSVTDLRPRIMVSYQRSRLRPRSAPPARSITITSAPMSASIIPQNGPGPMASNSTTLIPLRGPIRSLPLV